MNLQEWSFIAEIIAATAVVLSLCFLAFEIRIYARQSRENAQDLVTSRRYNLLRVMADNGELASIVWRGFAGTPRLPAHEWARFSMYLYTVLLETERAWLKSNAGLLGANALPVWEDALIWWLRHPGVRSWWRGSHPGFTPTYTRYIDGLMTRVDVDDVEAAVVAASFRGQEHQHAGPHPRPAVPEITPSPDPRPSGPREA